MLELVIGIAAVVASTIIQFFARRRSNAAMIDVLVVGLEEFAKKALDPGVKDATNALAAKIERVGHLSPQQIVRVFRRMATSPTMEPPVDDKEVPDGKAG